MTERSVGRRSLATRRRCDGDGLLAAFGAAVANLEAHVDEINDLNVFPVPDGDTGSNMVATVALALVEAQRSSDRSADRVAAAIGLGAVMGARGNSGVILSQIISGMARAIAGQKRIDGRDLARALGQGSETAYAAVKEPVEGTILTVIREAAAAAQLVAERDGDVESVLAATVDAADLAVARTPGLLPVLREAGVVDSGGQGLYRLLEGALRHLVGEGQVGVPAADARSLVRPAAGVAEARAAYGYETMFLLQPPRGGSLDIAVVRERLEAIGESVAVAGDAGALKVHVHSERPDAVIGVGLGLGTLSRITVENLDEQVREVREVRASAFTRSNGTGRRGHGRAAGGPRAGDGGRLPLAVVAVTSGQGLARIFENLGAAAVVSGGPSANPSTAELVAAVEAVSADEVLLLANSANVVLAARQAAELAEGSVHVIPTRNAAEGLAAMLALDPSAPGAANLAAMTDRGRGLATLQVTAARRDSRIGGRTVRQGQTIVLDPDDGLVAAGDDREATILTAIASLPAGIELLTLFYGDEADQAEARALAERISTTRSGVEVEVRHGGQPHYRYLVSAE
ncbi:MAG: fatty acid kinase [Chloroflexota bacterium]|jgi:DAK2 domain fusion protein YloV|nr:fatty acid kinase [Chloroflexota bacterium]